MDAPALGRLDGLAAAVDILLPGARDLRSCLSRIGIAMLKIVSAVLSAAAIAAVITIFLAPSGPVDAGPLAHHEEVALKSCTQRPWLSILPLASSYSEPKSDRWTRLDYVSVNSPASSRKSTE